jgi:hypothetical protein
MLVDQNARHRNLPVVFEPETFFGQLQHIIVVKIGPSEMLGLEEPETIILAAIRTCADAKTLSSGDIYYYSQEGCLEVIDIDCIQCCVGRIKDGNKWAIVDRSREHARSVFVNINNE